jgi:acetoacetyl-CoA synthetase
MMWNWQLSALAAGAEILLYDGSVSYPEPDALWRMVAGERVTVFGTSPAYLQFSRDAGLVPAERVDLRALRTLQSTGSVLADAFYPWVRDQVAPVPVQSISGGTDIIGCFVLGNPNLPVYEGESQCISLGLDVRELRPEGTGGVGELVCASPFPSRPLGLWADPDGRRFHDAYFTQNPGLWTHGDFLELTPRGGARILGRSDGVMNIRGIRIGPAEIYGALAGLPEIAEAMAVEQSAPAEPGGSRLVLLVVLRPGAALDRPLALRIKKELRERRSMAHVPAVIAEVAELPTTHNGKRSERAARDAVNGRDAPNRAALRNPGSLDAIAAHPALRD